MKRDQGGAATRRDLDGPRFGSGVKTLIIVVVDDTYDGRVGIGLRELRAKTIVVHQYELLGRKPRRIGDIIYT